MFKKLHELGPEAVTVEIDGLVVKADPGETVAAVIMRQGEAWTRLSPVSQTKRAPYCMMGVCFECLAEVDGVSSVQTCMTTVRAGMRIIRQTGQRRISQSNA